MCRRSFLLTSFIVVLSLVLTSVVKGADPDLAGYWRFDDGSGIIAYDSSGNGNDGTFNGDPQWVGGQFGGALEFDGSGDFIDCGNDSSLMISGAVSMTAWIKLGAQGIDHKVGGNQDGANGGYKMSMYNNDKIEFEIRTPGNAAVLNRDVAGGTTFDVGVWYHVAGAYSQEDGYIRTYVNGVLDRELATTGELGASPGNFYIGCEPYNTGACQFNGIMDDLRLYSRALTETEILGVMTGGGTEYPFASNPSPADGALYADTWVTLSWRAGDFAVLHDVYLSDSFDNVNDSTGDAFRGSQAETYYVAGFPGFAYPDGLVPGTTYYWRIDEVNEADPNSPWRGDIWSFSIPPKTAYNPDPPDGAESVGPDNVTLTWTPGYGAKLHTVYFDDDFDTVANAAGGMPSALTTYKPGSFQREKIYYWRIDEFDAIATYKGDVWCFSTPGAVGSPQPANKAADVGMNAILSWTPADSAVSHQLYFGTDEAAVRTAGPGAPEDKGSVALGDESYDPGLLEADTTYYWRVDEVDAQGNTAKGPLWIFTTGAFLVVDDFEGYTDDDVAGEAIWQTWIDGFGVADNGAQAGNLIPPYCEQTIVHGGGQSMPLFYVNDAGVTNSEAAMTLTAPRDWTLAGVAELSLWFRGRSGNAAEPLYVTASNAGGTPAVVANGDPTAAQIDDWAEWRITLQALSDQGINLKDVDKIAIGLGGKSGMAAAGGSGTMYIDDIRLYRP